MMINLWAIYFLPILFLPVINGLSDVPISLYDYSRSINYPSNPVCGVDPENFTEYEISSYIVGETVNYYHKHHVQYINAFTYCTAAAKVDNIKLQYCQAHLKENVTASICIPLNCSVSESFNQAIVHIITNDTEAQVLDPYCIPAQKEYQWYERWDALVDQGVQIVSYFFIILIGILDWLIKKKRISFGASTLLTFVMAFSFYSNLGKLSEKPPKGVSIDCLYGIRVLSMLWTVIGHSYMFMAPFIQNLADLQNAMNGPFFVQIVTNFTLSVDTFFLLSGCLTAYAWFRKQNRTAAADKVQWHSWPYWIRYYRHRLIRLIPAYAFVLIELIVRYGHVSFRPLWPLMSPIDQCRDYWWQNALFLNSIFPNRCMPWMWYLANDFIYFLLSPIFLLLLRDFPKLGIVVTCLMCVGSSVIRGVITVINNFPPIHMLWHQPGPYNPDLISFHINLYIKPYARIGPYLIGILLGYFLIKYSKKLPNGISFRFRLLCWCTFISSGLWSIFGAYSALRGNKLLVYDVFFASTYRSVFSLSVAWIITVCYFDGAPILNRILSCKVFVIMGNLSYSVYLFHVCSLTSYYFWTRFPMKWKGHLFQSIILLLQILFVYGAGFLLYMSIEQPCMNLENEFLLKKKKASSSATQDDTLQMSETNKTIPNVESTVSFIHTPL